MLDKLLCYRDLSTKAVQCDHWHNRREPDAIVSFAFLRIPIPRQEATRIRIRAPAKTPKMCANEK